MLSARSAGAVRLHLALREQRVVRQQVPAARLHGRSLGHLVLGGCFDLPGEPQVAISDSALVVAEGRDRDFVELDEDVRVVIGAVSQLAHRARERHRRLEAFEIERLLQRVVLPFPSRQLRERGLDLVVGRQALVRHARVLSRSPTANLTGVASSRSPRARKSPVTRASMPLTPPLDASAYTTRLQALLRRLPATPP